MNDTADATHRRGTTVDDRLNDVASRLERVTEALERRLDVLRDERAARDADEADEEVTPEGATDA